MTQVRPSGSRTMTPDAICLPLGTLGTGGALIFGPASASFSQPASVLGASHLANFTPCKAAGALFCPLAPNEWLPLANLPASSRGCSSSTKSMSAVQPSSAKRLGCACLILSQNPSEKSADALAV